MKHRVYEIALNPEYDEYQRVFSSMMYNSFDRKIGSGTTSKATTNINEVPQELHKPVIKIFKRRKVCARFKGNIWAVDLG